MDRVGTVGSLIESRTDPDGRTYWIDYRPRPPSWEDPRSNPKEPLPQGVEVYINPDGKTYYVDTRPKTSWTKPTLDEEDPSVTTAGAGNSGSEPWREATLVQTSEDTTKRPPARDATTTTASPVHEELKLLLDLSRWRFAQALSGYPDARVDEIDILINLLQVRLASVPDTKNLRPLDPWFRKSAVDLISSRPNVNFMSPQARFQPQVKPEMDFRHMVWLAFGKPVLYTLLLGVPTNYKRRLGRADWIQWASSKRWVDQQQAMDGFLKSLISEWNLMILLSTLILSTSVGFLSVNDINTTTRTAILISLIFSLTSIVLDVGFIWRYQRQLTNNFDMRAIMDEFIFNANDEVLAVYLALPISFLLWSVLTFFVGVVSYAWSRLPNLSSPIGVTATLGAVSVMTSVSYVLHRWEVLARFRERRWGPDTTINLNDPRKKSIPVHRTGPPRQDDVPLKPLQEAGCA